MLDLDHLEELRSLEPVTFDGMRADGYNLFLANSINEEHRKHVAGKIEEPRTRLQIMSDVAKGIGFESILLRFPFFREAAPAVQDPRTELKYSQRQKDLLYKDSSIQVKTVTKLQGNWAYISASMLNSVRLAMKHNETFIFGLAQIIGERNDGATTFVYRPGFVISAKLLDKSIRDQDGIYISLDGANRRPEHFQAIAKELLDEDQEEASPA